MRKVYFRNKNIYVQNNTLKTSMDRTISGDNRFDMLTNFNEILDDLELISTKNASDELVERVKHSLHTVSGSLQIKDSIIY